MKYVVFLGKTEAESVALTEAQARRTFAPGSPMPPQARSVEAQDKAKAIRVASAQRAEGG